MYFSMFMLQNMCFYNSTWIEPNFQEILNFISMIGPRGPKLTWNKNQTNLRIQTTSGKMMMSYFFWYKNDGIHGI